VREVDLFLYPLQFGSANWGLFELLIRGRTVIASDRCFLPEVIHDGANGYLLPCENVSAWTDLALDILDHPDRHSHIPENARRTAQTYSVDEVAPRYMRIFEEVVETHHETCSQNLKRNPTNAARLND